MHIEILKALNAERAARRAAVVVTDEASGEQRFVRRPTSPPIRSGTRSRRDPHRQERHGGNAAAAASSSPCTCRRRGSSSPARCISARRLRRWRQLLDYDVTIIDPRTAFATPERFPDVKVIAEWPDVALPPLNVDQLHGVRCAHPRSEDRRSGADARARARLLLYRRARLEENACAPRRAAERAGRIATPRSRAFMRRSGCISARCRRRRSPSSIMGEITARLRLPPEQQAHEIRRRSPDEAKGGDRRAFDPHRTGSCSRKARSSAKPRSRR